jgi:hypothetical protein
MQQEGTITFEPVVHTSPLETWHIVVAVLLFAAVICGLVWRSRRQAGENPGTLNLRGDRTNGGRQP